MKKKFALLLIVLGTAFCIAAFFSSCKKSKGTEFCPVCAEPGPIDVRMEFVDNDATWEVSETRHLEIVK